MAFRRRRKRDRRRFRGVVLIFDVITTGTLFSGFYAIVAPIDARFHAAAWAIFIALVLDGLDGRIARITHSTSGFGVHTTRWPIWCPSGSPRPCRSIVGPKTLYPFGWVTAFLFVVCGD